MTIGSAFKRLLTLSASRMTNLKFKPVTHVLFDLDGLLIDTETHYFRVIGRVIERYNKEFTWQLKEKTCGYKLEDAAAVIIKALDLPLTIPQYCKEVLDEFAIGIDKVELMPGARRLIEHLHNNGIPMAVCTGSSSLTYPLKVNHMMDLFGEGRYFSHVVLGGEDPEIKANKPAPDCYLVCAKRFSGSPDPSQCLAFEDSPPGVEAAMKAGMQTVMVPDPRFNIKNMDLFKVEPTIIIPSLLDFKPELFGMPPFPSNC